MFKYDRLLALCFSSTTIMRKGMSYVHVKAGYKEIILFLIKIHASGFS
jgi:hypothetical protein